MNSSKRLPSFALAPRFNQHAGQLLVDFANTHPENWTRFVRDWGERVPVGWRGGEETFAETQTVVREIWEGKHSGYEQMLVAHGLSLHSIHRSRQEEGYFDENEELFHVHWEYGVIWADPRDLGDYVWLSLLQYSRKLALCANKDNDCPTPYFLRGKKSQKFCSEACAGPSQREFKRKWFREHGDEWRKNWLKKHAKVTKKARN
jgi:hypothetical protein